MTTCPSCGSAHLGPDCGLTFAQRIRTVTIDPTALPVKHARHSAEGKYYDRQVLDDALGTDRKERMMEATKGLGYARADSSGRVWRKDRHSGEAVPVTEKELDTYLGRETEREFDPAAD